MNILAIDLGTQTGWAALVDGVITSGTQSFTPGRFEGAGMRFLRFTRWLTEMHELTKCEVIYFEEVRRHLSTDAAHAYGGYMACLTMWCEKKLVPHAGLSVGTIKKNWTGNGNSNKEAMLAEAVRRGFTPRNSDEADALAILDLARKVTA